MKKQPRQKRPREARNHEPVEPAGLTFIFSRTHLLLLGAALLAPWLLTSVSFIPRLGGFLAYARRKTPPSGNGLIAMCKSGPWGHVQYRHLTIEPNDDFLTPERIEPQAPNWFFKGYSEEKLRTLADEAGLTNEEKSLFLNKATWKTTAQGIYVSPGNGFVLGLRAESRAKLQAALAPFEENVWHNEPCAYRVDTAEKQLAASGLPEDAQSMIRRLTLRNGPWMTFSDPEPVLSILRDEEDRKRLVRFMLHNDSLMLQLRVTPETDVNSLAGYWTRGRKIKDAVSLLTSVKTLYEDYLLDVVHLLPPLPRALLYTHPTPFFKTEKSNPNDRLNCYWTAVNFFNRTPENQYREPEEFLKKLLTDYYPVEGQATFGDVMLVTDAAGKPVHACSYIADDIVFTKNGGSFYRPWTFMKLDDVLAAYSPRGAKDVIVCRRRDIHD